jgi:hypothetical protein
LTAYEIPLSATDQRFQIPLNGVTYQLTCKWCDPASAWTLDIATDGGEMLVAGIPIVTGVDLLEQYRHIGIAGQLVAQTDGDTFTPPTLTNLGIAGRLYFIPDDAATSTTAGAVFETPVTPGFNALGALAALAPDAGAIIVGTGATWITQTGATARASLGVAVSPPQGRLTLTSGVPVLTSSVSGASTVYYTPYVGQACPIWNGASFVMVDLGGELSQALSDATKSPAAAGASAVYDLFVWVDGSSKRCTRGPAWSTATSRGTGAGTTETNRVNGTLVNKYAITNGPAAGYGTYVGSIATNASSTVDFIFGGTAAGGTAGNFRVSNYYNKIIMSADVRDSTASYTYTTAAYRAANASSSMRVTFLVGSGEDGFDAKYMNYGVAMAIGIGLDATTATASPSAAAQGTSAISVSTRLQSKAFGLHYVQAVEYGGATFNVYPSGFNALTFSLLM